MSTLSLLPETIHIQVAQNTSNVIEFTLTDAGDAVDITNDTVTFVVKTGYGGTSKISKSNGVGAHSTPLEGKTRFTLSKTETTGVSVSVSESWVYQVRRIVAGSGDEIVYMQGNFYLNPSF